MKNLVKVLEVRATTPGATRGLLTCGEITFACALGRSGLTRFKREGDGATPMGSFELLNAVYRADRGPRPRTELPVERLVPTDGWCDDPRHPRYNRPVDLPFEAGHEKMWRDDRLYDIVVVLNQNMFPAVAGRGSAIFFHVAREGYLPTEGCVAVAPAHMRAILERIGPGTVMNIA
ncbi:L,D-transpeptidase family protein [Roseibium aestuarii]|uniref:L,D-transpeptidase n=1 Tax=Roseibium aestuarii TaxID=2600299 RepID=A0ABW4K419_9HYPH|nr:L,D-transpeptidase family protein [Roseibium aestuarii]